MATVGCNGLSRKSAAEETFEHEGKMTSVKDFFERKLGIRLRYPNLPCLWVGDRRKRNYVPMEVNSFRKRHVIPIDIFFLDLFYFTRSRVSAQADRHSNH